MATLAQINPEAKVYRKQNFDWRRTPIRFTQLAATTDEFGRDAAMDDFDRRNKLHTTLDKILSHQNYTEDRAARMHTALDRLLDSGELPEPAEETEDEEEPEEVDEEANVTKHEAPAGRISAKDSSHRSYGRDAGKCPECRIQDNHIPTRKTPALDAAGNDMAQTIVKFWAQYGVRLREV